MYKQGKSYWTACASVGAHGFGFLTECCKFMAALCLFLVVILRRIYYIDTHNENAINVVIK